MSRRLIDSVIAFLRREVLQHPDRGAAATFERGARRGRPTAWILSYTGVSNEPRVLRQAASLVEAGWQVVIAGFEGHSPRPPEWSYVRLTDRPKRRSIVYRALLRLQSLLGKALYIYGRQEPKVAQLGARLHYFALPNWRHNHFEILRIAASVPDLRPDLVVAHDYHTCPPADALARRYGAKWVVDCHEYGRGQYMHDPAWVRDGRYFATALQDDYLARADAVTTVCDGIAALLDAEQIVKRPVVTVRSMPARQTQRFRPVGETITVLYHGIIAHDRGLREAVQSIPLWRPEFRFVIRGAGEPDLVADLMALAERLGVLSRFAIEAPVAFSDIVPAANGADIGYFVQPDVSLQKRYTLPNKFFEYVMAGLALCVSDLPEMAALVRRHDLGVVVPGIEPRAIADCINGFSRERIEAHKRASLAASEVLNWESEQKVMLSLFDELVAAKPDSAAPRR